MSERERIAALERRIALMERRILAMERGVKDAGGDKDLTDRLIRMHGYAVNKTVAAEILGVTRATVYARVKAGKLVELESRMISVQSIGDYLSRLRIPA